MFQRCVETTLDCSSEDGRHTAINVGYEVFELVLTGFLQHLEFFIRVCSTGGNFTFTPPLEGSGEVAAKGRRRHSPQHRMTGWTAVSIPLAAPYLASKSLCNETTEGLQNQLVRWSSSRGATFGRDQLQNEIALRDILYDKVKGSKPMAFDLHYYKNSFPVFIDHARSKTKVEYLFTYEPRVETSEPFKTGADERWDSSPLKSCGRKAWNDGRNLAPVVVGSASH